MEAALTEKTEAALDAVFAKKAELLAEGVSIVGDKVEAADNVKYDTVAKVTGKYYCSPGYCTLPAARKRALLQQSSQCQPCGADYYCPGGFQTLSNPNRVACPEPVAGSNIVDFTTDGVTTATSRNQCLVATATTPPTTRSARPWSAGTGTTAPAACRRPCRRTGSPALPAPTRRPRPPARRPTASPERARPGRRRQGRRRGGGGMGIRSLGVGTFMGVMPAPPPLPHPTN